VLFALAGTLALFATQEGGAVKPLVRKDLLVFGKGEVAPPLRDIFRPKAAGAGTVVRGLGGPAVKPTPGAPAFEEPPSFNLNVSYIGSVKSGGQTIALVLRGGQTLSVREGDEVAPGYKVISVTAEAIVIRGPNGETKTFPKQGDRP
jgi:hypothetical protein